MQSTAGRVDGSGKDLLRWLRRHEDTSKIPSNLAGPTTHASGILAWQKTWTALNPDWEWKLWTEDNLPDSRWPDLVKQSHGYSQMSNIYRYEILLREGGVYVDTDCECSKPIEPLISDCEAFVVRTKRPYVKIGCGTIGGVAGHPLFHKLVERLNLVDPQKDCRWDLHT